MVTETEKKKRKIMREHNRWPSHALHTSKNVNIFIWILILALLGPDLQSDEERYGKNSVHQNTFFIGRGGGTIWTFWVCPSFPVVTVLNLVLLIFTSIFSRRRLHCPLSAHCGGFHYPKSLPSHSPLILWPCSIFSVAKSIKSILENWKNKV